MSDTAITEICFALTLIVLIVCITVYNCIRVRAQNKCKCDEEDDSCR